VHYISPIDELGFARHHYGEASFSTCAKLLFRVERKVATLRCLTIRQQELLLHWQIKAPLPGPVQHDSACTFGIIQTWIFMRAIQQVFLTWCSPHSSLICLANKIGQGLADDSSPFISQDPHTEPTTTWPCTSSIMVLFAKKRGFLQAQHAFHASPNHHMLLGLHQGQPPPSPPPTNTPSITMSLRPTGRTSSWGEGCRVGE